MRVAGRAGKSEAGYALLFVYAMAAVVAVMLYSELPRVAFEAQRDKEQLLIDRGEQYSRAITLYVRKFSRFPTDFDALDKTTGQRFLRHRYKDPMTGKDEWRIIHVGPGGVFTDSLLYTKKSKDEKKEQNFITELQTVGGTVANPAAQGVNLANRQRPSDLPNAPGSAQNAENGGAPNNGIPNGFGDGANGGGANGGIPNGVNGGIPNGVQPSAFQTLPNGQVVPATPSGGFAQNAQQPALPPGVQFPPGVQPPPGFGQNPGQPSTAATNLIGQILTTPRPGGLNGNSQPTVDQNGQALPQGSANGRVTASGQGFSNGLGGTAPPALQGQTIGGGIAGVASKMEREGIKIYRDRTSYNEWEFVYDLAQDKTRAPGGTPGLPPGVGGGTGQTPVQPQPQPQQPQTPIVPPAPAFTPPAPYTPPGPYAPAAPVYTPPPATIPPDPASPGVPSAPAFPPQPGQPGFNPNVPVTPPVSPGFPGNPFDPSQPGAPVYPVPGQPVNPGGILPGPPVGGGQPH